MSNNKTYTEKELEVFTQLYSSNFEAKCVQEYEQEHHVYFDWKQFSGKKMKEKLEAFNKAINYPTPFDEEVSTNSFEDWIEWLSNNGKQVTIDHEDFKDHYNNLETFEDNLKAFERFQFHREIDEEHYSSVVFGVDNNQ